MNNANKFDASDLTTTYTVMFVGEMSDEHRTYLHTTRNEKRTLDRIITLVIRAQCTAVLYSDTGERVAMVSSSGEVTEVTEAD